MASSLYEGPSKVLSGSVRMRSILFARIIPQLAGMKSSDHALVEIFGKKLKTLYNDKLLECNSLLTTTLLLTSDRYTHCSDEIHWSLLGVNCSGPSLSGRFAHARSDPACLPQVGNIRSSFAWCIQELYPSLSPLWHWEFFGSGCVWDRRNLKVGRRALALSWERGALVRVTA